MAGDFDFDAEEPPPPKPVRRVERAVEDEEDDPAPQPARRASRDGGERPHRADKKVSPLVWGGIGGGLLLVIGGGIAIAMAMRSKTSEPKEKPGTTVAVAATVPRPAPATKTEPVNPDSLTADVLKKVQKSTLRVVVLFNDGKGGSGSGFVEKSSGWVITNAHVVGKMKGEPGPRVINLIVNSGEGKENEYPLDGELMAWDDVNDLALIRPSLIEVGKFTPIPEGLVIPKSATVALTQKLWVSGFPLGTALGTEISVRPTTVSSFRKENGKVSKIQVEGGMTFGNSGGPVVDGQGNVVGVAVSGIKNESINFAIPAEIVQEFIRAKKK